MRPEPQQGERDGVGFGAALLSACAGTALLLGADLLLGGHSAADLGGATLGHLLGFAAALSLPVGVALFLAECALRRRGALFALLASLPFAPVIWLVADASLQGGQARRYAAGGLTVVAATIVALVLVAQALLLRRRLARRGGPLPVLLLGLATGALLHLVDRRLLVGLYPTQHAALGFFAVVAIALGLLGGLGRLRSRALAAALLVVLPGAATWHLAKLHAGPMAVRALLLSEEGLVSTRELERFLPYRRPEPGRPEATDYSPRFRAVRERHARALEQLAGLRPAEKLDVVVVSIDAVRNDHTSLAGYERDTTPFLAELARESVVFENAYAPSTASFFSISSMLSGAHPSTVSRLKGRDPEFLAEVLHRAGWWTIGWYTDAVFTARPPEWSAPDQRFGFENFRVSTEESVTLVPMLLDQIDRRPGPYFLFSHFMDPHFSYEKHAGFDFGDAPIDCYDSELAFVDLQLRRFVGELRDRGLLERTILVVTSDHGEAFGEHGALLHGGVPYEEQARVPLLVRVPFLPGGRRVRGAVSLASLPATVADLLGVAAPRDSEATSLLPDLLGLDDDPDSVAVVERPTMFDRSVWPSTTALVQGRWKLIHDHDAGVSRLFDLESDPGELRDLAGARPDRLRALLDLEESWRADRRLLRNRGPALPADLLAGRDRLAEGETGAAAVLAGYLDSDREGLRRVAAFALHDAIVTGLVPRTILLDSPARRRDEVVDGLAALIEAAEGNRPFAGAALALSRSADVRARRRAAAALWRCRGEDFGLELARAWLEREDDPEARADLLATLLHQEPTEDRVRVAVALVPQLQGEVGKRLVYALMALEDARLGAAFDRLVLGLGQRIAMNALESMGARDTERRRAAFRRFLRLRAANPKRSAIRGLHQLPASAWKRDLLIDLVRREPHDEIRIMAGIELAAIRGPEVDQALLDALAAHPVTGLGFGHLLATTRPQVLADWSFREDEVKGELARGRRYELSPDFDRPWGRRMRRLLLTALRDPEIPEAQDTLRVVDATGRSVFECRHVDQAAMYYVPLPVLGEDAVRFPIRIEVDSGGREPGAVFGELYATVIPYHDPIEYWPARLDDCGAVGILARFDGSWDCDFEHDDRVFLVAASGRYRQEGPGAAARAVAIEVVGGGVACELEILRDGHRLARRPLAPREEALIAIEDLGPDWDPLRTVEFEFRAPALVGSFDPAVAVGGGLALKGVNWR